MSDELISGWLNSLRVILPKFGTFQLGGNVRKQTSGDLAYVAQFNLRTNQLKYERDIGSLSQIYFEYEIYQYGYGVSPFDYFQQTVSMTYNQKILNSFYLYGTVDTVIDDLGGPLIHLFMGTSYRF
jgi:hypothetical protein